MNSVDFDRLARDVAGGSLNRRAALKVLALGALAAGLQALGWRGPNVYAQEPGPEAPAADPVRLYLPAIQRACTEASRCGARKYCDVALGCLCVQTTEGDLRCGLLPSCDTKLCASSADCAELGPGAFCDTPLSGCCQNPPNTLSRCLLPCPPCAAQLRCGSECCSAGQVCRNGRCATPDFCDSDPISDASIAAAQAALAGGATSVPLSPNGCQTFSRTLNGATLTEETLTFAGFPVWKTSYGTNSAAIRIDHDQDGFAEEQVNVVAASGSPIRLSYRQVDRYHPATRRLIRTRREDWRDADTFTVNVREYDTAGNLIRSETFVAPQTRDFPNETVGGLAIPSGSIGALDDCSAAQRTHFEERLKNAMNRGRECFVRNRHRRAGDLVAFTATSKVILVCDNTLTGAYAQNNGGAFPIAPIIVKINPTGLEAPTDGMLPGESISDFQSRVLFHEVSHSMVGDHSPRTEFYGQFDPTTACDRLCFDPNANQCHCQTCLGEPTCNNACSALPACNSSIQQCGSRCCVGPCDGATCCPSERVCSKKPSETAVCCAPNEVCINLSGGSSSCCPSGQVCRAPGAGPGAEGKEICCQPGQQCTTDPLTQQPKCWTPQIYCPGCPQSSVAPKCFPSNKGADCSAYCTYSGFCNSSVRCAPAGVAQCP